VKTKRTVRNCPLPVFRRVCPQQWEALTPTDHASVRFCGQCNQNVYLCSSDEETLSHARAGHCVAREIPDASELPAMYIGQPKHVPPATPEQEEAERRTNRERWIDDALKNLRSPHACPQCHYPVPAWRTRCRVCGLVLGGIRADAK
jgi:predicted amidophosphoribosyltransferase